MKIYNKLVRDKIPQICKENGQIANIRELNDEEYLKELNTKLKEEVFEYLESEEIEELADLEEVLLAIVEAKKIAYDDFEKIRLDKTQKRGAFKDKIFLISVEENKI